jgi:transposase
MKGMIAGIDVHKRVLMAVIGAASEDGKPGRFERRRFGSTSLEISNLSGWLVECGVQEVVMESTAQYWKPVWLALEGRFGLHLAQAWSNRAPRGKKTDFKDAERLVRRYCAEELTLSFVPDAEQRQIRTLTRRRTQLTRDRIRIQNQVESLLEETRIKLSSVVSDLFGASGLRILEALAGGETDAARLAALADARLQCPAQQLTEALTGAVGAVHRLLLGQHLNHLQLIDRQIEELSQQTAVLLQTSSQAIARLVNIPGIGAVAAQQIVAEAGPQASTFASAAQFSSWIGVSPGKDESAEQNSSSRCAKGNHYLRVILCQAAQAAVRAKQSVFEQKFRRLLPRLGYTKAVWAIAHHLAVVIWKVLHQGVEYVEYGMTLAPEAIKRRLQRIKKQLRELGYSDELRIIQTLRRAI